jgi:hypothetical protein
VISASGEKNREAVDRKNPAASGLECMIVLVAALGFEPRPRAWILKREQTIKQR